MKPILFNTEMVRAILDGRKTDTRRVVKPQPKSKLAYIFGGHKWGKWTYPGEDAWKYWEDESLRLADNVTDKDKECYWTPPYYMGDILYVHETWGRYAPTDGIMPKLYYKADGNAPQKNKMDFLNVYAFCSRKNLLTRQRYAH